MAITKDTLLGEILEREGVGDILIKHNFPCVTCPFARMEMDQLKIGKVCEKYGIDAGKLVAELNKKVKK